MGRYDYSERRRAAAKKTGPHPIWRGIGCLMAIFLPLISYALAKATIDAGIKARWSFLPYDLLGAPSFPDYVWKYWQIARLFYPITQINNLYANLVFAVVYLIILSGVASLVYSIIYRYIGPPRYGPQDIPPPKIKTKPYKR
jgi:hypothetical protein